MSLRSMRKAARLAASGTHPSRTQRSRFGIESGSDRGPRSSRGRASKIIMVSGTPIFFRFLTACPQVPTGIVKLHSFRAIHM
jgi:hypothetical protein